MSDGRTTLESTDPAPVLERSSELWAEAQTLITTGTGDPVAAAWYLTTSRVWPLMADARYGPFVLGFVLFAVIAFSVLLSPSAESHFIYTDF